MVKIEYLNDSNKEYLKKIIDKQHNELLDKYISHLNEMVKRNLLGVDKSVLIYQDGLLVMYLDFAVVNKALFLTNKYIICKSNNLEEIKQTLIKEFEEYDLINLNLN